MQKFNWIVVMSLIILSCGGNDVEVGGEMKEFLDEAPADTTSNLDINDGSIVIISASIDGPDAELFFYNEEIESFNEVVKEIHIVPVLYSVNDDSSQIDPYLLSIVSMDFKIWDSRFENFTGAIKIYYNIDRSKTAVEFALYEGEVEGDVYVYDPQGDVKIHRKYTNGKWIESFQDVYAIDWTFNPELTVLTIQNIEDFTYTNKEGKKVIELGESFIKNENGLQNDLYQMIQKPVFERDFIVNGQAFTGVLTGYFTMSSLELDPYFVMNFENGKLHGIVELYDSWMGLVLEERFENGELVETIYEADESEMDGMAKPVIYLYPEKNTTVNVKLNFDGKLTHSYPTYPENGWQIMATSNGTLFDATGKEYYALFWEGQNRKPFTYTTGFVIKGSETVSFLENSLEVLGLNRREANEFIMYWLPQMENNAYNVIHFSTQEYEDIAELEITPKPETMIRIMMVWSPLEAPIEIPQQNLYDLKKSRTGFTVVEWGGKRQDVLEM